MSTHSAGKCWNCSQEIPPSGYGRQEVCERCGKDTRVCKNCIHYDPSMNNQCRENQADRVVDKEKACFCDYFKPKSDSTGQATERNAMKAAAEALFKKK